MPINTFVDDGVVEGLALFFVELIKDDDDNDNFLTAVPSFDERDDKDGEELLLSLSASKMNLLLLLSSSVPL